MVEPSSSDLVSNWRDKVSTARHRRTATTENSDDDEESNEEIANSRELPDESVHLRRSIYSHSESDINERDGSVPPSIPRAQSISSVPSLNPASFLARRVMDCYVFVEHS